MTTLELILSFVSLILLSGTCCFFIHHKYGHKHTYEIIKEITVYRQSTDKMPSGYKYVSRCTTCGKIIHHEKS